MDLGLGGKVVMITGASRGLGRAMAEALGAEGARLSLCARGAEVLEKAAGELRAKGYEVAAEAVDVADAAAAARWVEGTAKRMGALAELDEAAWQAAFQLNFFSAVRLAQLCAPLMERRGVGSIINISSVYGREAGGPLTYNASKAAMISFTKNLSRELAPKGIRVNTIAPGSILYPGGNWEKAFKANPAFEKDFIAHDFPAGRLGRPEEVAYAVVCLASPKASWITGTCLPVDGAQGRSLI